MKSTCAIVVFIAMVLAVKGKESVSDPDKANTHMNNVYCSYMIAPHNTPGNCGGEHPKNVLMGSLTKDTCDILHKIIKDAKDGGRTGGSSVNSGVTGDTAPHTTTTTTTAAAPSSSFAESGLLAHNAFRAIHGSPAMTLDPELTKDAEQYARELAKTGQMQHASHNSRGRAGENLAMDCSSAADSKLPAAVATKRWYEEVCTPGYSFAKEDRQWGTDHFTQVIWNSSTKLGIGRAIGKKNGMTCSYVVARYRSVGNITPFYTGNVLKGTFTNDLCHNLDGIISGIPSNK